MMVSVSGVTKVVAVEEAAIVPADFAKETEEQKEKIVAEMTAPTGTSKSE